MNNDGKPMSVLEIIGMIISYILVFPFAVVFGITFVVLGSIFCMIYLIFEIIAWPITEIVNAHKLRKEQKKSAVSVIDITDRQVKDDQHD